LQFVTSDMVDDSACSEMTVASRRHDRADESTTQSLW